MAAAHRGELRHPLPVGFVYDEDSNVVDLMEALRRSVGKEQPSKATKKLRKAAAGQKEMLLAISGKKPAKENAAKKTTSKPQRKSA